MSGSKYREEVQKLVANMDEKGTNGQDTQPFDTTQPLKEYDVYIEPDRITFIQKPTPQPPIVDSTPAKIHSYPAILTVSLFLLIIFSSLTFQLYILFNPFVATVTIIPKSQELSITGTLQLGRVLNPITISQSQTAPTTGKGHQDARSATGFITFYNGLFTSQTVPATTVLTSNSGEQFVTDQDAVIPAASPSPLAFGYVTVSAHAKSTGASGNIPAYDINQPCCASGILAKNTQSFTGGQNERNFQTVAKSDIDTISTTLKPTISASMQGALTGQGKNGEAVKILPCIPTVTPDHRVGEEAVQVKVTVTETCSAVAYNETALQGKATDLLNHQAEKQLGAGYSLFGSVQVSINQATVNHTPPLVFLSFKAIGAWVYALSRTAQEQIKQLIAGKTKQEALHILESHPGIEQAAIAWRDDTRLPKNSRYISLSVFVT